MRTIDFTDSQLPEEETLALKARYEREREAARVWPVRYGSIMSGKGDIKIFYRNAEDV